MTRAEIISLIRDALGYNQALDEAIILRTMDKVQFNYELGHDRMPIPWFCFNPTATITTVADTRTVALPTGFTDFDEDWSLSIQTAGGEVKPLERMHQRNLVADTDLKGFPNAVAYSHSVLHFYPLPDAAYTATIPHYARTTQLSTTTASDWYTEFPNLLIEEVALEISKNARDKSFMQITEIQSKRADYISRVEQKRHALVSYQVGGSSA